MTALEAWIPGQPIPQQRARVGSGHHVMGTESRRWREGAALVLRTVRQGAPALDTLCRVEITVVVQRPKHRPERTPADVWALGDRCPAANAGDIDNYAKAALDAAVDAGWLVDDYVVVELVARKVYAAHGKGPGMLIRLEVL